MADPKGAPNDGDQWRINFSRVEWQVRVIDGKYQKVAGRKEDNWVWSPQGVVDMHRPETWGYLQFSTARPGAASFRPDPTGPVRHLLHHVYYAQQLYRRTHGRYAAALDDLNLTGDAIGPPGGAPRLQTTESGFEASMDGPPPGGRRWHIRNDSLFWSTK